MNEDYPYQIVWEKYRFWWKLYWLSTIPLLGFMISVALSDGKSFDAVMAPRGWVQVALTILGSTFVLLFTFISLKVQFWTCPRCGGWFNGNLFWINVFARKCRQCGLRKYEGSTFGGIK